MKKFILLFIYLYITASTIVSSQDYYFNNFEVYDGLSHNTIQCAVKDSIGLMWFGSKNGLNRYDGISFKVYKNDPKNPYSLGSNFIESLNSKDGELWVGTDSGLFLYDYKLDRFLLIEITRNLPILDIESDSKGNLWFISNNILYKYNKQTKASKKFDAELLFPAEEITITPNGEIWIASRTHLHKFIANEKKLTFENYYLHPLLENKLQFNITKISALNNTALLIGSNNHGAYIFDLITLTLTQLFPTSNTQVFVRDFIKRDNDIWIATESGIMIYNLYSGMTKNLKRDFNDPFSISDNAVYCFAEDDQRGLWIGTYFGGINYLPLQTTPFRKYFPKIGENSISGFAVREIKKDQYGNLWIGTEDAGLNKFNPKTGVFKTIPLKNNKNELNQSNIHAILPVGNTIWVSTFEGGIYVIDAFSGKFLRQYKAGETIGLYGNFVISLYETKSKNIFAATSSGVYQFNPLDEKFTLFKKFPDKLFYTSFLEDNNGGLWAGTYWDGLYYYNPKTEYTKKYKKEASNSNSLSSNAIHGIFEDKFKQIWITTANGLNLMNSKTKGFSSYTIEDGFPSNVFYSIIEDTKNNFWISTANGLVLFNRETGLKEVFTIDNGILNNQFNYNSAFQDTNGQMYFGSVAGLISFHPSHFKKPKFNFPIILTDIKIKNKNIPIRENNSPLSKSITFTKEIILKHNESSINLEFAALNFTTPRQTEYSYKLEGLNDEWINLGTENKIFFTELPTGDYKFYLKSQVRNEEWGEEYLALKIKVLPPLLLSRTAYAIYFILFFVIIYTSFKYYHMQVKAKNNRQIKLLDDKMQKEIYKSKIKFFTHISHEIQTPLTLIKSPLEIIEKKAQNYPEIKENILLISRNTARLLDLVNQLLDFSKIEKEEVKLTFINTNINELLSNTISRFKQVFHVNNLNLIQTMPEEDIFAIVDVEAVKKILSNLLVNAKKYAKSNVYITLTTTKDSFILIIENDGNIIPIDQRSKIFEPFYRLPNDYGSRGSGLGLSLASSLAKLHKGSLKMDLGNSNVNTFILKMPLHQENEFNFNSISNQDINFKNEEDIFYKSDIIDEQKSKILLVEDNVDLLNFLAKELREQFIVIKAISGEDAFEKIKNSTVQLIITDAMMTGITGFEFCKKIRTTAETSHIPVILLTSKSDLSSKIKGLEAGADAYIEKPFSIDYMKFQITNLLKNRSHIQNHFLSSPLSYVRNIAHSSADDRFLKRLEEIIQLHITDNNLSVEILSNKMNMSRSTLFRKIKNLTGLSPIELINNSRLKKAAELLKTNEYKIFEVSDMVGFNSVTSFGRNFQRQYKMTPTEFLNL